jgi:5-methyltetrahydropteroyltriglutamate--homocysteine methyltransferase
MELYSGCQKNVPVLKCFFYNHLCRNSFIRNIIMKSGTKTMITAHTDVVGSLLRPPELLQAREDVTAGNITQAEFKAIEDQAVDEAIALQEEAGLDVVTDGEMRRLSFQSQMTAAVEGFGEYNIDAFLWGDWYGVKTVGDISIERPANLGVVSKLRRKRYLSADEFTYLRARTTRTPKITLPSPSLWTNFWSPDLSVSAYPTLDSFLADVVDILREEVAELVRLGATYIQLDAPHYPLLLDSKTRSFYEQQGWPLDKWLQKGIEMDNTVMGNFPGVTFGIHL